jgi:hypothetical protein
METCENATGRKWEQVLGPSVRKIYLSEIMKPKKKGPKAPSSFEEADLLSLELRVARHADRLWRSAGYRRGRDLIYWLQAESAVLAKHFGLERATAAMLSARP